MELLEINCGKLLAFQTPHLPFQTRDETAASLDENQQNFFFNCVTIISANSNLQKGRIRMGRAEVDTGNINRSPTSYEQNPAEERAK